MDCMKDLWLAEVGPWLVQVASLQAELAVVQAQLASRLAVAALQQQQQQQHHQQHHHGGSSSPYDQQGMPGSSMSMAAGSSSVDGYSNRVKEEAAAYHHGMQAQHSCYDPGHQHQHNLEHMPSSPPDEMDAGSRQKARSDSMEQQRGGEDVGDLQALAHALLCRK